MRLSPRRIDAPTAAVVAAVGATAAAAVAGLLLWGDGMPGHSDSASAADTATSWPATLLFCGGWLLITVAMMLPTSLPLLVAVRRVAGAGRDGRFVLPLVVVGYLAVWAVAGIAARAFSLGVAPLLDATRAGTAGHAGMPGMNPAMPGMGATAPGLDGSRLAAAAILVVAGAYQLSPLALRCLRACRSPFGFLARGWTGRADVRRQAVRIGVAYGRSCLGCCAGLMAVLLVVGMANPGWMLALGAVMAVQKNAAWGARLALASGCLLIAAGVVLGLSSGTLTGG